MRRVRARVSNLLPISELYTARFRQVGKSVSLYAEYFRAFKRVEHGGVNEDRVSCGKESRALNDAIKCH